MPSSTLHPPRCFTAGCNARRSTVPRGRCQASRRESGEEWSRRDAILAAAASGIIVTAAPDAQAIGPYDFILRIDDDSELHCVGLGLTSKGKKSSKKIPIEEYSVLENGLKYYDLEEGAGSEVKKGDTVKVHFDVYIGIVDAVSSRYATLLGKNEIIPEPYEFTVGKPTGGRPVKKADGGQAGGSFSGQGGPKPPPALSTSVIGMRKGGKRSVIVTPDLGYGEKGFEEIPGGATVEMQVELLEV